MAEHLSGSLRRLIAKSDDPAQLDYVIHHLGTDVPANLRPKVTHLTEELRTEISVRKLVLDVDARMRDVDARKRAITAAEDARKRAITAAEDARTRTITAAVLAEDARTRAIQTQLDRAAALRAAEVHAFSTTLQSAGAAVQSEVQSVQMLQTRLEAEAALRDRRGNWRELLKSSAAALEARLYDKDRDDRLQAISAVVVRRVPAQGSLIQLLGDRDVEVRKAAHEALVFLARGTDFGPAADADRGDRLRAADRWEAWWAEQDNNPRRDVNSAHPLGTAPAAPPLAVGAPDRPATPREDKVMTFVLKAVGPEAGRLGAELAGTEGEQRTALITDFRVRKGGVYSDALVAAVLLVAADQRGPIREALAERLARMTPATLRARLGDEEAEYRRAATRALASRADRAAVPWLIPLLDDTEPAVAQAAHAALKSLTNQDLGPAPEADRADRVLSMAAWLGWWKQETQVASGAPGN